MLKDEAKRDYQRRYMQKKRSNIGSNITDGSNIPVEANMVDGSNIKLSGSNNPPIPDIIDKLTDPVWREKLERICQSFKSRNPYDMEVCWLGDMNLSTVCGWLDCTQ